VLNVGTKLRFAQSARIAPKQFIDYLLCPGLGIVVNSQRLIDFLELIH
jgi:hypothetical protein